ncbi:FG-GAP repeat domain-containing protein [Streptomyces sp. NPDC001744]|uniref:FG-GAP repeat domain-containing protein n=1 Tax=Streptomyces sp. NPDC001744 TaxID=3364606 RepID=UPI00368A6A6D
MRTALSRCRAVVSTGVVLAVVGTVPLLAPAATAAPANTTATAAPAATTAAPIPVPFLRAGGSLAGAGTTGFLSRDEDWVFRWTRYADGVSTVIEKGDYEYAAGSASDVVAVVETTFSRPYDRKVKFYDMATGAAPATIDLLTAETGGKVEEIEGSTLVVNDALYGGSGSAKLVSLQGTEPVVRRVADPRGGDTSSFEAGDTLPGIAFGGHYSTGFTVPERKDKVVLDLATGHTVERYEAALKKDTSVDLALISPKRVAWTERVDGKVLLASAVRGEKQVTRVPLGYDVKANLAGGMLGDWFMSNATSAGATAQDQTFTARSLADGTTFPLLTHARSVTKAADGTLLALGTTAGGGNGVYRIALGTGGRPEATLIASAESPDGNTTPLRYVGTTVPAVVSLDGGAKARLAWKFSTTKVDLAIEFRYKESSRYFRQTVRPGSAGAVVLPDGSIGIDWAGVFGPYPHPTQENAPNGAYEWRVTAKPWNGMSPVTVSGEFKLARTPKMHDYTDDGSPDLLLREQNGFLDKDVTFWDDETKRLLPSASVWGGRVDLGNWNLYDRTESVGDVAGSHAPDIISRDKDGVLWAHLGDGRGEIGNPLRVGGGWGVYDLLAGGSDLTGDGRADLTAIDKAGDLYLYQGTGDVAAPYKARKKIGVGWGIYNDLVAVGNVAGAPAGDLVARDKAGLLWLYLGKGDGTYAPRIQVGGGWGVYGDLVGMGDANKDGRPDLYARTATGEAYFYAGTGSWGAPFAPRADTTVGVPQDDTSYDRVF